MDDFPDWAKAWLSKGENQVSHGLNLALKLESPEKLSLLLWDIMVAKPKIELAMRELSFIHFARFVPSWDGSALMVTTEFDGPLEPYVMDFVIALGDVFDVLLSYVDPKIRPTLPTREHPDEFWAFVQQWNRVPFIRRDVFGDSALFPPSFDFPVYSAYAQKTVTDIVGKRTELLPPAIDRPGAYVDLDDVQGNILNGYRAKNAVHLFFEINDHLAARKWLAAVFPEKNVDGATPWGGVMSATRWKSKADGSPDKPPVMANVGFTYAGLEKLLPDRHEELARFSNAFREGAEKRGEKNGDVGPSAPQQWLFGQDAQNIHVVVSLYASGEDSSTPLHAQGRLIFTRAFDILLFAASNNGMTLVYRHEAHALPDARVYFNYKDGISKPRVSGQCHPSDADFQPAASPGEFLLGKDYASIFGGSSLGNLPEDLASNGTFGALRLLEQNEAVFEQTIKDEAARLSMAPELLKAKLLGRWSHGEPLALDPETPSGNVGNNFDYAPSWEYPSVPDDHEGQRCPVSAHIRRTNPRTARVAGQRHSRRLIRRGMPTTWDEDGTKKVGLLGLFIGASLERQFEFIQQQWIQADLAASGMRGSQDPIAGLRSEPTPFHIPGVGTVNVPPLVVTRGSLYLFFPSLSMLRNLDRNAAPSTLRILTQEASRAGGSPLIWGAESARVSGGVSGAASAGASSGVMAELPGGLSGSPSGAVDPPPSLEPNALLGLPGWVRELLEDLLLNKTLKSKWVETLFAHFASGPSQRFDPNLRTSPGDIRPLDPRFIADPYPAYARLRQAGQSVVWVSEHQAYWVLGRSDAQRLFAEPENFLQQPSDKTLRGIITMDGPRHTTVRAAVVAALKAATANVDAHISNEIEEALARLSHVEQFDFMTAYGSAVPRAVFWRFYGVPSTDINACDALAQTMMLHYGQPERPGIPDRLVFADASVRLSGRLALMLAQAWLESMSPFGRQSYDGTVIGEIARRTHVGIPLPLRPLDFFESLVTLVQLVLAGYMSSQFLLGSAMRNLLTADPRANRRGQTPWAALSTVYTNTRGDFDAALATALEEARRVDAPVTIVERYAARDTEIGGVLIPKDCPVFAVVASANRDAAGEDAPEEFHWDRVWGASNPPNLSLGHGIHECVGKPLQAKLVPKALTRLMEVMPNLRLCDSTAVPAWFDNLYFRGLRSLPVTRCLNTPPATES